MLMENFKKWKNPQKTQSEYNIDKEYMCVCFNFAILACKPYVNIGGRSILITD